MTFASDDLASVLVAPDREFAGYGQALLRAFDNETFDNVVEYRGALLHNLPVLDRVGGLSYKAGDVVLLMKWRPTGGGLASLWIAGSPVVPGAGRAEQAVEFLRGELAAQISAEVFASRIFSVDEDAEVSISHTSFTFVSAAGGPSLTGVPITAAGRAIVFASANIGTDSANAGTEIRGFMSYEVSGASTVAAVTRNAVQLDFRNDVNENAAGFSASRASLLTGLNEGLHNFEAKYQVTAFGASDEAIFLFRNLTVIAF